MNIIRVEHKGSLAEAFDLSPTVYHAATERVEAPCLDRSNAPRWRVWKGYPVVIGMGKSLSLCVAHKDDPDFSGDSEIQCQYVATAHHFEDALDWIEGVRRCADDDLSGGDPEPILSAWEEIIRTIRASDDAVEPDAEEALENPITAWSHADPAIWRLNERREAAGLAPIRTKVTERA